MTKESSIHIRPGQVKPACDIQVLTHSRRSVYAAIAGKVMALKPGEALELLIPEGVSGPLAMNRLNAGLALHKMTPPEGYRYCKRRTQNGKIAILCVKAQP